MSETLTKIEVMRGPGGRRRFTTEQKLAVVAETLQPGMSISYVARRHGLSPSLVFRWRRLMSEGGKEAVRADDEVVSASEVRRLEERVREHEPYEPRAAADRVLRAIKEHKVRSIEGVDVSTNAQTVCIHSDTPGIDKVAPVLREVLRNYM